MGLVIVVDTPGRRYRTQIIRPVEGESTNDKHVHGLAAHQCTSCIPRPRAWTHKEGDQLSAAGVTFLNSSLV
jgi:hypothetical protein